MIAIRELFRRMDGRAFLFQDGFNEEVVTRLRCTFSENSTTGTPTTTSLSTSFLNSSASTLLLLLSGSCPGHQHACDSF